MAEEGVRIHPDALERRAKKEAADAEDRLRKQEEVSTALRKQAMAEVKGTIVMMREMDQTYSIDADTIAAMVDDRVARMKAISE